MYLSAVKLTILDKAEIAELKELRKHRVVPQWPVEWDPIASPLAFRVKIRGGTGAHISSVTVHCRRSEQDLEL